MSDSTIWHNTYADSHLSFKGYQLWTRNRTYPQNKSKSIAHHVHGIRFVIERASSLPRKGYPFEFNLPTSRFVDSNFRRCSEFLFSGHGFECSGFFYIQDENELLDENELPYELLDDIELDE